MLIHRGQAVPVMDLAQVTEGRPCANRLSSRIVGVRAEVEGGLRQFGVLAERVGLCESQQQPASPGDEAAGPGALGELRLDEQGVFQLVEISRLVTKDRQAFLFPIAEKER
jgi:chemotaxis-related protein WspB